MEEFGRALSILWLLRSLYERALHHSGSDVAACIGLRACGKSISRRAGRQAGVRKVPRDRMGDEIQQDEIPLTARVITTRVAKMPWGAIYKIEFTDLRSRSKKLRQIRPDYFIATDERIVLLNEENNDAVKKISAMDKAPTFEDRDVRGITSGKLNYEEGPWTTTIEIKGNKCIPHASHNSGHFTKIVWKKGVGLVEYASG